MKVITVKEKGKLSFGYWEYTHNLAPGIEYVFYDKLLDNLNDYKDAFTFRDLDDEVRLYSGQDLTQKALLFSCMGGYGDILCAMQALNSLQSKYPEAQIDLTVHMDMYLLVKQFGFKGDWLNYPIRLDYLRKYDFFLSTESIYTIPEYYRRNFAGMFCDILDVPLDLSCSRFNPVCINRSLLIKASGRKKAGIQVDSVTGNNRNYPVERIKELAMLLSKNGFEVYLFGFNNELDLLDRQESIYNLVNKVPTVVDLAMLLSQMNVVIGPDSVGGHLGGTMDIPTVVLFGVTSFERMSQYPSVHAVQSQLPCSPCYKLSACPEGYSGCVALNENSVSPENVFNKVIEIASD